MSGKDKSVKKDVEVFDGLIDNIVNEAAAEIAEENGLEDYDVEVGDVKVEKIEDDEPQELKFIGSEPSSNSNKAKRVKKSGTNDSMDFTPWKGIDMWGCRECGWSTFDKRKARYHCCD